MRPYILASLLVAAIALPTTARAQHDDDRKVTDGGIKVAGWQGRIDRRALSQGKTINDSRFAAEGRGFRASVGPAGIFWNPANTVSGDYEVMGTFTEHKMAAAHPHSYGLFIGGQGLESDTETLMYCIVYGTGNYAIKTFRGATVSTIVGTTPHPAIKKADATTGQAVNTVGWRVRGGQASCVVNGQVVRTLERAQFVAADKLTTTDGIWGIRATHNVEFSVSGLMKH
jgi:hypothetical protein